MVGTPGAGYPWPPYSPPSTHEGESQRAQFEAALSFLREQRAQIAAEIGEYLYGLVIQGQMRDPVVLATCRRLYDHEQQMAQLEASLRALPVASPPVGQPPGYTPVVAPGGLPGFVPGAFGLPGTNPPPTPLSSTSNEDGATMIAPIRPPVRDARSHDADATRIAPAASGASDSHGSRSQSEDAATLVQRAVPASHDAQPPAHHPADHDSADATLIAPVRQPASAGKAGERLCTHCRMPLRANDATCPVCGKPVAAPATPAPQCRRCRTALRQQDAVCPVCGTPRI
jgi:RNA polymerase subunit RPABC4/transcription elongation factor Spt4